LQNVQAGKVTFVRLAKQISFHLINYSPFV
jgi:hypothetical protein